MRQLSPHSPNQHSPYNRTQGFVNFSNFPWKERVVLHFSPVWHLDCITKYTALLLSFYGAGAPIHSMSKILDGCSWDGRSHGSGSQNQKKPKVNFSLFLWNIFLSIRVSAESTFQEFSNDKMFTGRHSSKLWQAFA